jgi:hypothetical protein
MARSENSRRTDERGRGNRRGPQDFDRDFGGRDYGGAYGGGQDFDYSGGNLKYGTGKFTQRENDGYGVNISKNGRSMQDSVYREDRNNVDRARGRPRNDFGSRMDEIEDLERGMRNPSGPREGMRDRIMRSRNGRGGGMMRDANDLYDVDGYGGGGIRDRIGGGLLRDLQDSGGRNIESYGYDNYGSPPKVMGGSSKGRGGGYRSSQFEASLSNEHRRFNEFGHRMDDMMDYGHRGDGGPSNFDRLMGRDFDDHHYDHDIGSSTNRNRHNNQYYDGGDRYRGGDYYDDHDDFGRGGGGRLLRDHRR